MVRKMTIVKYSADWPNQYKCELAVLGDVLGDEIVHAHHIGSTSVPGLAAKPVIDILLEVRSVERLDAQREAMEGLGYQAKGEFGIPGRRYYPKGGDARTYHVHAFVAGDSHVEQHLAFRNYLRAHPAVAAEYAAVKRAAAAAHETDPEGYVSFKQSFIQRTVSLAVDWERKQQLKVQAQEREVSR